MFKFDQEQDGYTAELNGVEFFCDEPSEELEAEARKLSKLYWEKLPEIIGFMLPELEAIYGKQDPARLPDRLGKPTVNLTTYQISYFEQTLDGSHIIEFEYAGDFEGFDVFNIDG